MTTHHNALTAPARVVVAHLMECRACALLIGHAHRGQPCDPVLVSAWGRLIHEHVTADMEREAFNRVVRSSMRMAVPGGDDAG